MCAEEVVEFSIVPRIDEVHKFMEHYVFYAGLLGFVEVVVQRYDSFLSVAASPECFHLSDLYQVCHRT